MKVLLINNFFYRKGGSEAVFFNTAELLQESGHDVVFFSFKDKKNIHINEHEYFIPQGGSLKKIRNYFYNKQAAQKLEKVITKEKPDIAHVHLFWGGISPSIFNVLKRHHVPLVHTAHDYRMVCPSYTFKDGKEKVCERCKRRNYYQCTIHRCSKGSLVQSTLMTMEMYTRQLFYNPIKNIDGFIFVSQFSAKKHIEHNKKFGNTKHIVLYNYTKPLLQANMSVKEDYFLFYGRLSFEKGIPTLLKVFAQHPELKLKVVGTGPLEDDLKTEYEDNKNIQFLGYHSGKSLAELIRRAKYVCVPSEWYENNPMTIVESYSLGTPVIGSRIGGIPEIINEKETGFMFESGNTNDLERTVKIAESVSQDVYYKMCDKVYQFYRDNFSEEKHKKRLLDFYETIIK